MTKRFRTNRPVAISEVKLGDPTNEQPVYTFDENGSMRPRLLNEGELPEIQSKALRRFINCVAVGDSTSPELKASLSDASIDDLSAALSEGIRRWHAYGKERE